MKSKRTYNAVDVEKVDAASVAAKLTAPGCVVGVDVAKTKFVAAIGSSTGEVVRLVRFEHPRQTPAFLRVLVGLREAKLEVGVVMEPTGTYGDALRYQCHRLGFAVHMMSPKHTHDLAEVLDGVPSMHDPKAATALVRLQALRPARRWEPDPVSKCELRALLDQRAPVMHSQERYFGLLEAMLSRHWPELDALGHVRSRRSCWTLLLQMPSPRVVAAASERAAELLRRASHGALGHEALEAIVASAEGTLGAPMSPGEEAKLRDVVAHIERDAREIDAIDKQLARLVDADLSMQRMAETVGVACAAAIFGYVGSPAAFSSTSAFEKALGLNLRERSSGEKKGRLSITKRGPAEVRQLLYLAALRLVQRDGVVGAWYRARSAYRREAKCCAVVAVMRKLARALWHVAGGAPFDAHKLFDLRRLGFPEPAPEHDGALSVTTRTQSSLHQGGASQTIA